MSYTLIWAFEVERPRAAAFEAAYAGDGPWARLFARAEGYEGTSLLKNCGDGGRYITVDRWSSAAAYEAFKRRFGEEYRALDRKLEGLAASETMIGAFEEQEHSR